MSDLLEARTHVRTFQPRFAELVELGAKCQTVRKTPKRQMRSKQRKIGRYEITRVCSVRIDGRGVRVDDRGVDAEAFAKADGFSSFEEMLAWFRRGYGGEQFDGTVIFWHSSAANL